jgi:HSP20 family protein
MKTKTTELTHVIPPRELDVFENLDRIFDSMQRRWMRPFGELVPEWPPFLGRMEYGMPSLDMIDREKEILVRVELPGMDKKDLKLDLQGELLTITGERHVEEEKEEGKIYRAEIMRGAFARTVRLPEPVDAEKVDAVFKDGLLEIHLPKTHVKERHQIEVK